MDKAVIVFIRYPEPGKVKTRLARDAGKTEAAQMYKKWTEETILKIAPLVGKTARIHIAFDPAKKEKEIRSWLPGPFRYVPQGPGDLGKRLSRMASYAFEKGAAKVVLIGSDCPDMDLFTLRLAFSRISTGGAVLGPAKDGGYYLVGLSNPSQVSVFADIPWSTPRVFKATVNRLKRMRVPYSFLPLKRDIDTIKDLLEWIMEKKRCAARRGKISVVIPVLNEEDEIAATLKELKSQRADEILVVDGGSTDKTREIAARYTKVIPSEKGRAVQMNEGAARANGDILLFLHADTHLPPRALEQIRTAISIGRHPAGRFRMSFGHPNILLRLTEFQTRFQFFSYGDQAFFMERRLFEEMGGFDPEAPFEDVDFYRRLLRNQKPIVLPSSVRTSPRRYLENGIPKQKLINFTLASMYYLGLGKRIIREARNFFYTDIRA